MSPYFKHVGPIVLLALLLAPLSCARSAMPRQGSGTCEGACTHYLNCKGGANPDTQRACLSECSEVFSDPESLRQFERLRCSDAVAFVEGESGRGPAAPERALHER